MDAPTYRTKCLGRVVVISLLMLSCPIVGAQVVPSKSASYEAVRVRFVRFGASSLDVEIFAYVFASDWHNFLEIQEELLYGIMDIVQKAEAAIALPSQTLHLATDESDKQSRPTSRLQRAK